ncbi:MAG: bifunctional heptose 7-phosphate kinase/heptose 1-phosphate adenyltransferase, partial [Candidatus Binatia bacterium]
TQKSRLIAHPRHQQIVRLDREDHRQMDRNVLRTLRRFLERHAARFDGIVLSDYGKGVIHPELLAQVGDRAERKSLLCVVDPKKENFGRYRGFTLVTPNREEASEASGIPIRDESSLEKAGAKLLEMWLAEAVLITRGQEGMSLFRRNGKNIYFPTAAREVFDVTGAGDTVVAACALALGSGSSFEEAAVLANLAAGVVVGEVGTFAVPIDRLRKAVRGLG